jgi:hypothetical protein
MSVIYSLKVVLFDRKVLTAYCDIDKQSKHFLADKRHFCAYADK